MKYIYILLFIMCIMISCQNDDTKPDFSQPLSLDSVEHLIPLDLYSSNSNVVFVNESGDQKTLTVTTKEEQKEKIIEGQTYLSEAITISLKDETDASYSMHVKAESNYVDLETPFSFVTALLFTFRSVGFFTPTVNIDPDGSGSFGTTFESEKQLLSEIFSDVYTSNAVSTFTSYTHIYYTTETGVIGFTGEDGELWVFKEYK